MRRRLLSYMLMVVATAVLPACGTTTPPSDGLRESFLRHLAANRFIRDVQPAADEVRFSGPGVDGKERAAWRVHVDEAVVEKADDPAHPFKGVVRSSWYADDALVKMGVRESNLPIELTSNGLAQECWALWDPATKSWGWE